MAKPRTPTPNIPGFRLIEELVPRDVHDRLLALLDQAVPERNDGHYDGFEFADPAAFDSIVIPCFTALFGKMHRERVFRRALGGPLVIGCTMVGYEVDDFIRRHTDSPLLAGEVVSTVSLGTSAVLDMYEDATGRHVPVLVPPRSLYVFSGAARTDWSHEIKPGIPTWQGRPVPRGKRYALVFFEPGRLYRGEHFRYPTGEILP